MRITNQDLLSVQHGIIAHQVNCKGVMGAGLAKQIRSKYPQVFDSYSKHCSDECLGKIQLIQVTESLYVANLFSQLNYGRGSRHTDYEAMRSCFLKLNQFKDIDIYLPYAIGCGLAGGDWQIVSNLIDECLPTAIVCKL